MNKPLSFKSKKIITYFVIVVIFYFLLQSVFRNWKEVKEVKWNFGYLEVFLILAIMSTLHFLNSLSWHFLTKAMDLGIGFGNNMRIWLFPNITRYIPGVIWQYVGRVYLLSKHGVTKARGTFAVLMDAIFTFSIGSLVVLLVVLIFNFPLYREMEWLIVGVVGLSIASPVFVTNQKLLNLILLFVKKVTKKNYSAHFSSFRILPVIILSFVNFTQFVLAGLGLFLIAKGIYDLPWDLMPFFVGVYSASWVLGYVSFFAPGGLGVQELSIAGLLSIFMPFSLASLAAILFRLSLTLAEFVITSLVFWKTRLSPILHTEK